MNWIYIEGCEMIFKDLTSKRANIPIPEYPWGFTVWINELHWGAYLGITSPCPSEFIIHPPVFHFPNIFHISCLLLHHLAFFRLLRVNTFYFLYFYHNCSRLQEKQEIKACVQITMFNHRNIFIKLSCEIICWLIRLSFWVALSAKSWRTSISLLCSIQFNWVNFPLVWFINLVLPVLCIL